MSRPWTVLVAALAFIAASTSVAHAQEPNEQPNEQLDEAARLTFHSAREAFVAGDYERALGLFRQSYELSQRPGLLYNIAQTLDRLRRDAETLQALRDYLEAFTDAPNRTEVEARIRVLAEQVSAEEQAELERQREEEERRQQQQQQGTAPDPVEEDPLAILHPAIFISVGGVALVGGGLAVWAGLETSSLNDAYEADTNPTTVEGAYDDAASMQLLANIFIFSSAGLGVAAAVLAIITDWGAFDGDSESAARVRPAVALTPWGASAGLEGSF